LTSANPLQDKVILVVDDEQDIIETIEEELDICLIHKATNYETALQYLLSYTYDFVILDIMGVNGFELLKDSVSRGFPTIMLTAHALSPESLKTSINMGATFFLPKEKISDLKLFLEDVVKGGGKPIWQKLFNKLGSYFSNRFGPNWKKDSSTIKTLEEEFKDYLQKH